MADEQADYQVSGGGGGAGAPVVRAFPFAYNLAGLADGAALYTPTIGDLILDMWISILTQWDGTTPRCDVGTFVGNTFGLWSNTDFPLNVGASTADDESGGTGLLSGRHAPTLSATSSVPMVAGALKPNADASALDYTSPADSAFPGSRTVPALVTAANPIKVVVSTDGTTDGADPGATGGSAVLYIVTCTPVTA